MQTPVLPPVSYATEKLFPVIVHGANRFVILTTTPNASMHGIHDRMPLILRRDQIRPWLTDAESALHLLAAPPPLLERHSTDGQMSFGDLL